jgi:hypothetical protein
MPAKHHDFASRRQATWGVALADPMIFHIPVWSMYNFKDYFKR